MQVDFLIQPHQGWAPQSNARHVRKMGAQTQHETRPQVGRPNAIQGTSARWPPKRKTHLQRKRPHKGALGLKTSWRMDKNKFWLGGRLFNTTSPRLGAQTQRMSASWAPKHNARQVHKMGAQTKNSSATKTSTERSTRIKVKLGDG